MQFLVDVFVDRHSRLAVLRGHGVEREVKRSETGALSAVVWVRCDTRDGAQFFFFDEEDVHGDWWDSGGLRSFLGQG